MVATGTPLTGDIIHQICRRLWPGVRERLRASPPDSWSTEISHWLDEMGAPQEVNRPEGLWRDERLTGPKLAAAMVMVSAVARLHRARTGTVRDAFRDARDRLMSAMCWSMSPQEVVSALDLVELEARSLEQAFRQTAA